MSGVSRWSLVGLVVAGACPESVPDDDSGVPDDDAGPAAGSDGGVDAGTVVDAGPDAGPDGGPDAGPPPEPYDAGPPSAAGTAYWDGVGDGLSDAALVRVGGTAAVSRSPSEYMSGSRCLALHP